MTVRQQQPVGREIATNGKESAFVRHVRIGKTDNIVVQPEYHLFQD